MVINGDDSDNFINGTDADDVIYGFAGTDFLSGLGGNDTIYGGDDQDRIEGGAGDDLLDGGSGNDTIVDFDSGSDTIRGGSGNDSISVAHFGQTDRPETIIIDAGTGRDDVGLSGLAIGTATIDLGDDDDRFSLGLISEGMQVTLKTGAGRDLIVLAEFSRVGSDLVVTDFQTGSDGDMFDISAFIGLNAVNWDASNPFGSGGYLRLRQVGTSAILELDRDGATGQNFSYVTIARFADANVNAFNAFNFAGYDPSGAPVVGVTVEGTALPDFFFGTVGADIFSGFDGDDTIFGSNGNDTLNGGAGADLIRSGYGDDLVDGGEGDDTIEDVGGSDTIRAGGGNDTVSITRFSGLSNEYISVDAGTGDDRVYINGSGSGSISVDLGDGNDLIEVGYVTSSLNVALGKGLDEVRLTNFSSDVIAPVISDFQAGAGGDNFFIGYNFADFLIDWDGRNPFESGYLRLIQLDGDTLVQADMDGAGEEARFLTIAVLQGVDATSLTADNFTNFEPLVGEIVEPSKNIITGTDGSERLSGTDQNDVILGLAGDDRLFGDDGLDLLEGGQGNDVLRGGRDADVFLFAGKALGSDRIEDFDIDDLLVTTRRLADSNNDDIITFGSDRKLGLADGGLVTIFSDTGTRITRLEYDGSFVADDVTYFVYSRVGSTAGVADAAGLIW